MERNGVVEGKSFDLPMKIVWRHPPETKTNGYVDWGPVVFEGIVYTGDGLNNILALDSGTGELLWKKKLISNVFSVSLSEDGKILLATTAITTKATPTLFALDPKTGNDLWDNMKDGQPAVGGMEGAPVIKDGRVYVPYLQYEGKGGLMAYEVETGKLIWAWSLERFSPYTPLSYSQNRLYVGFENKTLYCFDALSGNILWKRDQLPEIVYAAPTAVDDKVYISSGDTIFALNSANGSILWQKKAEDKVGHSSISYHDKKLYFGTANSKLVAMDAKNGDVLWAASLEKGPVESSPLLDINKGLIYLATQGNFLFALQLKDGKIKDQLQLSHDERGVWKGVPALYKGRLYIGSLDQTFYAVE